MAQKKYYAVKNGRKVGIFNNWDECKKQIEGYSGAIYKSFINYEEAQNFLGGQAKKKEINSEKIKVNSEKLIKVEAYVDGSYSEEKEQYSYGCVILDTNNREVRLSGIGKNKEHVSMRNVAGELLGAMTAIEWAYEHKYNSITIYHDYEGIARWANETWKTNKKGTKEYLDFIKKYRAYLEIKFQKVQAHSGNFYNEEADKLAKEAMKEERNEIKQEEQSLDERVKLFSKFMKIEDKSKNTINFVFKKYIVSESKLKKFIKEVWCLEGKDKNDIDSINLNFDVQNSKIEWSIRDKNGNSYSFNIDLVSGE